MYPKGPLSCLFHLTGGITGYPVGNGQPSPPVTPLPLQIIPVDQPLVLLPEETDLVALSSSFLRVHSQERQLFPVVHAMKLWPSYLRDKVSLHRLYPIDRCLVPRGPKLATIVQPW